MTRKKRGWDNPPPKVYISGTEEFIRDRHLRLALTAASLTGRQVTWASADEVEERMGEAFLYPDGMSIVCDEPEKLDPEMVRGHRDDSICLILYRKGALAKKTPVRDVVPNPYRFHADKPKSYKMQEHRAAFLLSEAKNRFGMNWPKALAEALVRRVGDDLGLLSFEVLKVCTYRKVLGGTDITPDVVLPVMWQYGEVRIEPLIEALAVRDEKQVLKVCSQIRKNMTSDGALAVPNTWVANTAIQWAHAAAMEAGGSPPEECAQRMGVHPFIYQKVIGPQSRKWGEDASRSLLQRMAYIDRARKRSHVDPWVEFEVALVQSCREARKVKLLPGVP